MVTLSKLAAPESFEASNIIHGDILEAILSHVPLVHLISASRVSKSWNVAVTSTLLTFNKPKPWLFVHTQSTRTLSSTSTHAFDPVSNLWIEIKPSPSPVPAVSYFADVRSSNSNLLFMLSPSKFSFSIDPLHLTWREVKAPVVWRIDPIVAVVGRRIVVAGSACDFEDDPLAVEVYDLRSSTWTTCKSMPAIMKGSASSTCIAANDRNLFVTEKKSGVTHYFDTETEAWYGPYDLRTDQRVCFSVIGFSMGRLILIGLVGDGEGVSNGMKLWEVNCETFECKEIGEMPSVLFQKMKGGELPISSIGVSLGGNYAYIHKPIGAEEVIVCEFIDGGCRWRSVRSAVASDRRITEGFEYTCSKVGMEELQTAAQFGGLRFEVKA